MKEVLSRMISYKTTPKLHLFKPNTHKLNFWNKNLWVLFFAKRPVLCLFNEMAVQAEEECNEDKRDRNDDWSMTLS